LRQAGLRSTALTLGVLEVLAGMTHPCSHEELAHELSASAKIDKVDRVTLYRILDRLARAGLVGRIQGSDRAWRYALGETAAPGYFECEQCHEITALPSDPDLTTVLDKLQRRLNRGGAQRVKPALTVHGTCKNCVHREDSRH
jgi:Fur family ferric uptake transcriptional regulator